MWRSACAIFTACLLTLCETGSSFASEVTTPLFLIETCINRLATDNEPNDHADNPNLKNVCPELVSILNHPRLAHLEPPPGDEVTVSQLYDIQRSLKSFEISPAISPSFDHAGLKQLLEKIYEPEQKPTKIENPIDKFWEWVGQKLRDYFKEDNWFSRHFDFKNETGTNIFDGIKNSIIVILIVLVFYIIINELRAAEIIKLFRRRYRNQDARAADELRSQGATLQGISDISNLPMNRQIPALLRYTLQYLIDKNVLPHRYNLTNQEFLTIIKHELPLISRDFELLVTTVDKVIYGRKSLAAGDASKLYDNVKKIMQLSARAKT